MPDEIFGVMAVKNGQKQTIMNLSNARQKSYADLQTMTDAQKKGVIVCPDYPKEEFLVTADEVSYGSGTVKDALDELTDEYIIRDYAHNYSIADTSNISWNPFTSDNIGISGYTPIGIITYRLNKNTVYVVNLSVVNSDYAIFLHNTSTQAATGTFNYTVLYKKA